MSETSEREAFRAYHPRLEAELSLGEHNSEFRGLEDLEARHAWTHFKAGYSASLSAPEQGKVELPELPNPTWPRNIGTPSWIDSEVREYARSAVAQALKGVQAELERERIRLAACGVIALSNTRESAAKSREMHRDYRSGSSDEVARAVDREMDLREELEALKVALARKAGQNDRP